MTSAREQSEVARAPTQWHALDGRAVAALVGVDPDTGLSDEEAAARLQRDGPNALSADVPLPLASTEAFTVLAVCQWWNALSCRSETESVLRLGLRRDRWLLLGIAVGILLQVGVLYTAVGNIVLRTLPIHPAVLGEIVLVASAVLWVEEMRKLFVRRARRRQKPSTRAARPLGAPQEGS
jgi:magnesium-transporting ATPase (P-type)